MSKQATQKEAAMKQVATLRSNDTTSGHTLAIFKIDASDLPECVATNEHTENFDTWYVVRNWDADGVIFMYLCKGHPDAPRQVCGFYRGGGYWTSCGATLKDAVNGMQRDGWMYA